MILDWFQLATPLADDLDGEWIEIAGWIAPFEFEARHSYFLLVPDMACCIGCRPSPAECVEVMAAAPLPPQSGRVRLAGRWHSLKHDPAGWRFQLRDAVLLGPAKPVLGITEVSRRAFVAMGAALPIGLPGLMHAPLAWRNAAAIGEDDARASLARMATVDIHSHAGRILRFADAASFTDVAGDMRAGGMAAICLAMVADTPATKVLPNRRIQAFRDPEPGELYRWSQRAFARIARLIEVEKFQTVTRASELEAARATSPAIVVSAEGADFLDTSIERLEGAHRRYSLRHLQLTHYRVNDLGDIQTEAPVHGGLTDFGAEVIRACNQLGIVVDIAHGTYDLVKRAASVTTKPLVLSHTSLTSRPAPRSRQIAPDHAKLVAGTGGVIGIWPVSEIFKDMAGYATGFARMADAIGVDHVGLGSDMRGLTGPSLFDDYASLPRLAAALSAYFNAGEIAKLLGGNYRRVFAQSVGN
ncbi:MAG: membrane dipeptidase [Rhodospirillales bacterium]